MAKILVVEDSTTFRSLVRQTLISAGHEVTEAVDGLDALKALRDGTDFSVIVCDVNMPNMDGLELADVLHKQGSHVPLVFLTTEFQIEMLKRAKTSGAAGWLVKPFVPSSLLATLDKVMATPR
jgi:two-component system chemotaxis response regulator CheY